MPLTPPVVTLMRMGAQMPKPNHVPARAGELAKGRDKKGDILTRVERTSSCGVAS